MTLVGRKRKNTFISLHQRCNGSSCNYRSMDGTNEEMDIVTVILIAIIIIIYQENKRLQDIKIFQ